MFEFKGIMSYQDYLKMIRRLSYRSTFISIIGGLIISHIAFTIFTWHYSILMIIVFIYLFFIAVNYFIIVPYNSKKKYFQNEDLREYRNFTILSDEKFDAEIYKISFYDDVIYITSANHKAMMIKKSWLTEPEKWEDFMEYSRQELGKQIVPKISRR